MHIRLLLGPAGSGKTFHCLREIVQVLQDSPQGSPLVLLVPKQTTYQLERQLLQQLPGFTRLHVLSFERLASYIFRQLQLPVPDLLDEQGRVMVLRALLSGSRTRLQLYRASARLAGFARQLSDLVSEFQRARLTPENLRAAAASLQEVPATALKLADFAAVYESYLEWSKAHALHDANSLIMAAAEALSSRKGNPIRFENLWVDGFAEISADEQELLLALLSGCGAATLTFCLDGVQHTNQGWLYSQGIVRRNFEQLQSRLKAIPNALVSVRTLARSDHDGRFAASPILRRLEEYLADGDTPPLGKANGLQGAVRLVGCTEPENEAVLAAREITAYVRNGARFRDVTVLVRDLELYYQPVQRVFSRYGIPFFLDRREQMSHHPAAELTRSALRIIAFGFRRRDWFAALKTGLLPVNDDEIDRLENEAIARGWDGQAWLRRFLVPGEPELSEWVNNVVSRLLPPFKELALALGRTGAKRSGPEVSTAVRQFWSSLRLEDTLRVWAQNEVNSMESPAPPSVHGAIWEQMHTWLEGVHMAFAEEALTLHDWLPILEAGLASLTVGVIPPAIDQVLVGAVDRSRSQESELVLVLGVNEGIFPARQPPAVLLTNSERVELRERQLLSFDTAQHHLARERYYAYVACTRARKRLVLTYAFKDGEGVALNSSQLISQLKLWAPSLEEESFDGTVQPEEAVQAGELAVALAEAQAACLPEPALELPPTLSAESVRGLYGSTLRTSVSRMEEFASCPFRFFVSVGLHAEERKRYELDVRQQGTFLHDVLAQFHGRLIEQGKRWRDITTEQARELVARISDQMLCQDGQGILGATQANMLSAKSLVASLQDFVGTVVEWMQGQYLFDPVLVEWPFGLDETKGWELCLDPERRLELRGRVDRVDICRVPGSREVLCTVIDYKSGKNKLDRLLVEHGIQLQLLTYLNVMCRSAHAAAAIGASRISPVGAFYVTLLGGVSSAKTRTEALNDVAEARKLAYRHTGRFDRTHLRKLDSREADDGDQFAYRLTKKGEFYQRGSDPLTHEEFTALLNESEEQLFRMAREIFSGNVQPNPFRKGALTACSRCAYQAVCRIDTWTHNFRVLAPRETLGRRPGVALIPGEGPAMREGI